MWLTGALLLLSKEVYPLKSGLVININPSSTQCQRWWSEEAGTTSDDAKDDLRKKIRHEEGRLLLEQRTQRDKGTQNAGSSSPDLDRVEDQ